MDDRWMDGQRWIDRWTDGQRWIDRWADRCLMDKWMDGWVGD